MSSSSPHIARPNQLLIEHLNQVALLSQSFAQKITLPASGELIGFLHDLGKYSQTFQHYIASATNLIDTDDADYVDAQGMKGKIDHSTAGAQWIWKHKPANDAVASIVAQILCLCVASHHSGLIDCLSADGVPKFINRMNKVNEKTFYSEVLKHITESQQPKLLSLFNSAKSEFFSKCKSIAQHAKGNNIHNSFHQGLLTRFLLSCLVDADRLNSAGRQESLKTEWQPLISALESHLGNFGQHKPIDAIRKHISESCKRFASNNLGTYFLTVPTGAGKTLASLRFALHHAQKHNLDRIFYIIPYTSIIEQNAQTARDIFADLNDDPVLEHHSNLTPDKDNERNRLLAENWSAPIVFTTIVQFLESLFASGTRGVRRMHQLSKSVIIFDEPQSIPLKVTHLFNQALNFLQQQCHSTLVLCTATQPLFHKVPEDYQALGNLAVHPDNTEIVSDKEQHFHALKRVTVSNLCQKGGYTTSEIAALISEKMESVQNLLFIANTKIIARKIFQECQNNCPSATFYHLSTNMCPAHRQAIFTAIKTSLHSGEKVVCISTQLIEAGVDISFECVIRSLAGLDSIAQAAGRCNRHGELKNSALGQVFIVNLNANEEILSSLPEIRIAQEKTERVLREFNDNPLGFDNDLIGLKAMDRYYTLYWHERANEMAYPLSGKDDSLLFQLAHNPQAVSAYQHIEGSAPPFALRQSFDSAGKAFEVIDAPTEGIVVPYNEEALRIIGDLCATQWNTGQTHSLLKKAQRFSVNLFASDKKKLFSLKALFETQHNSGIYYLDERFYDKKHYGIHFDGDSDLAFLSI